MISAGKSIKEKRKLGKLVRLVYCIDVIGVGKKLFKYVLTIGEISNLQ